MKLLARTAGLTLFVFVTGCATSAVQSKEVYSRYEGFPFVPSSYQIPQVPFVQQSEGHCGPATMAMAMGWAGKKIPIEKLSSQIYTPGMNGSLQSDMVSAARRNGFVAIPIQGLEALLKEIAAGNPVIVFENLALSWAPNWHYALVFGYDLDRRVVTMHSGPEAFKNWDIEKFERSWMLADYWGLVVLPPNKLSQTGSELEHVKAAAVLEKLKKLDDASLAYQQILSRWPKSLAALIGLANIAYEKKAYLEAEKLLLKATQHHPSSKAAWHNLAVAQKSARRLPF